MTQNSRQSSKRFAKSAFIFGLFLSVILFHKPLLLMGCKLALKSVVSKKEGRTVAYEKMQWEDGSIAISGLQIKDSSGELTIDRIECKLTRNALQFQPKITMIHPQILLSSISEENISAAAFLYRNRLIQPYWEIKNGVLQLPTGGRFYFSMLPGAERESIGNLIFSSDPDPQILPMFMANLALFEDSLQIGFTLQESDLGRLLPLTALLIHNIPRKWEQARGEVQLEGFLRLDRTFQLQELHAHGKGRQIALVEPSLGIDVQCEEITGTFSSPLLPMSALFEDQLSVSFVLKNGSCLINKGFGIKNLNGSLCLEAKKEPELILNGSLFQREQEISFECTGKAGWNEDVTFWSEIELNSISLQGQAMQTMLSVCGHGERDLSLHVHIENADCEHLDFMRAISGMPGHCLSGKATAAATCLYKEGNWHQVCIDHCQLENIRWVFPQTKATLFSQQIAADCVFAKALGQAWSIEDLHLQVEGADYLDAQVHFDSLLTSFSIDNKVLQPSFIQGNWGNLKAEIAFPGPKADCLANMQIQGDGRELLAFLFDQPSKQFDSLPLDLQLTAKVNASQLRVETVGHVSGEKVKGSTLFSVSDLSLSEMILGQFPHFFFKEAQFQAEQLTEQSYGSFVPLLIPGIELSGMLQCETTFLPSHIELKLRGNEILIQHPLAQLYVPSTREKNIHFIYDTKKKEWQGEIPLDDSQLNDQEHNLCFENLEGVMLLDVNDLTAPAFYAECEGLALRGNLCLSFEGDGPGRLSLSTSQIAGSVHNLFSVLHHFPSLAKIDLPIEGSFASGERGFILNAPIGSSESAEWSFKGHFNALTFPINEASSITEGCCDLIFDSKNQGLIVEKAEGVWRLIDGTPLTVQVQQCSMQLSERAGLDFAFKVIDGKREFAHFEGRATSNEVSQWEITFDKEKTYLGKTNLNITHCFLDEQMHLISFEMRPTLKCQDLHTQAAFLQNAGFLSKAFSAKNLQEWEFEGTLQTRLCSEEVSKGFSFFAESRDLKVRGKPWNSFQLKAHKIGENWLIEHLEGGGLTLKGAFVADGCELSMQHFEGTWHGIEYTGSGSVKTDQKIFSCKLDSVKGELFPLDPSLKGNFIAEAVISGDFSDAHDPFQLTGETNVCIDLQTPLALYGKNKRIIQFTYNQTHGLVCNTIDVHLKDKSSGTRVVEFKAARAVWSLQGNLAFDKIEFSLSPKILEHCVNAHIVSAPLKDLKWEGNLEGSGDFQFSPEPIFQATLKPGRYGFSDKDIAFEQLHMHYEKDLLTIRGKTHIENKPLWGTLQVDISKEPFGALKLCDHPKSEGVKILFTTLHGRFVWESAQGSCYGVDCELARNKARKTSSATVLSGHIRIDGHSLLSLLPKTIREGLASFQIGKGYGWQGDLILWQESKRGFQAMGTITGNAFEFLGYQFHRLQGNLEATPEHIVISDLKIDDPAGMIGIRKFELKKNEQWFLTIPHIFVRHLQPSLMRKIDSEPQVVKPFTIKNLTLSDIHCNLGDKSTLEGVGKLTFTNQFKKESSLLDIPLEMIKKIGLDPNLLTPVQGEVDIELHGDKLYLMSLKNSFSEGGRAEFYFAPGKELSYIDLDGKIQIDLKMHQDVMLKITEPFTLTIRGTLDKPRYGLQY